MTQRRDSHWAGRGLRDLDGELVRNAAGATFMVDDLDIQIMKELVDGAEGHEIARAGFLSYHGFKSRTKRMYEFFQVQSRAQFGATLVRRRIVP